MHEYLEGLLRHKSDMVNIEAARAICEMRSVTTAELFRPVAGKYYKAARGSDPLMNSPSALPFLTKGYSQVCCYQDFEQARHDTTCCRYRMQPGHGEPDYRL
jgi:hypothetical protein